MKYLVQRDNCQSVLNLKIITRTSIDRKRGNENTSNSIVF